jgi:DNA-directed RNA polymerase subunit E'/Rpb7
MCEYIKMLKPLLSSSQNREKKENNIKSIFTNVTLNEKIVLQPRFLTRDVSSHILSQLKAKISGISSKHGYCLPGSIEIYKMTPGCVDMTSLNGNVIYTVTFTAKVCNPCLNMIIDCKVSNINKMGLLATAGYFDEMGEYVNVLNFVIPRNSLTIKNMVNLDDIKINDKIKVEIIDKIYKLGDKTISGVGRIVKSNDYKNLHKTQSKNILPNINDLSDIDHDILDIEIDDEMIKKSDKNNDDSDKDDTDSDENHSINSHVDSVQEDSNINTTREFFGDTNDLSDVDDTSENPSDGDNDLD